MHQWSNKELAEINLVLPENSPVCRLRCCQFGESVTVSACQFSITN